MIRRLLIAAQFLTRLPIPQVKHTSEKELAQATMFFPLVGAIVGGGAALVFVLTHRVLPPTAAVFFTVVFTALITNGFHEDGLADTFDGFGGGWTRDQTLRIMHDSRIGTYGTLALIFLVIGKLLFLSSLPPGQVWRWLIVAHTIARWTTLPLAAWLPYARAEGQGKLVARQIGFLELGMGTLTLMAILLLLPWRAATAASFVASLVTLLSGAFFRTRIQGITGDCLGATNQLTELGLYLTGVVLLRLNLIR